jgi:proliferating cell nuclear antigen
MHLRTIQASAFRTIFEVFKDIINDVNLYFTPEGLKIITLDTARVTLIHMFLLAENFEEYDCPNEIIAGINISNTYKLLKSITNNDSVTLRIENQEILEIKIENNLKNSSTSFHLKLLDINEDILDVPDIKMDLVTTLPSIDFQRVIRDMSNLSQDLLIERVDNVLRLSCRGDFADQTTILDCGIQGPTEPIGNVFSLKYINMFTKATNLCSSVQIFQDDQDSNIPIIIRYAVANLGDVRFYLAPKVND